MYARLVKLLKDNNIQYKEVRHAKEGSCEAVSKLRGNELSQAMKAMVVHLEVGKTKKYFLAIVPGDRTIDKEAISKNLNMPGKFGFTHPDKAKLLTACAMGTVPPFTLNNENLKDSDKLKLIADPSIKDNKEIVFNACDLECSIFMSMEDWIKVAQPEFVRIAAAKSVVKMFATASDNPNNSKKEAVEKLVEHVSTLKM